MFSLIFGNLDENYQVVKAKNSRLEELGVHQGANIKIIAKLSSGYIIRIGDSKLSLDIDTVKGIFVK